ncbi:MAG TPA: diadenylate cyclase CdaA [Elusimicrobiota bacterium]|nr:diadenylate cyclase CdaA [Elusimicrobiota bacterium]
MTLLGHLWAGVMLPAIDILLIAFVFYQILQLIRGTQSVPVVMGLAVLMGITVMLRFFIPLPASLWLLDNFWRWAVLLLAVVFQPELRAALAHLGSHPMGRLLMPTRLSFVDEIIGAVGEAMQRQMGMLIVLEQDVGLRNYADTGTAINGEISKELLLAIFHYRSPLHDGAAIIQNDRLAAVGCLLPLSNDPGMAKILGTRHRAAVGLSEFTDAWVIVVSEETGTLSLARQGRLERELDVDQLRHLVLDLYQNRAKRNLRR